jgi:hypothetical protein
MVCVDPRNVLNDLWIAFRCVKMLQQLAPWLIGV